MLFAFGAPDILRLIKQAKGKIRDPSSECRCLTKRLGLSADTAKPIPLLPCRVRCLNGPDARSGTDDLKVYSPHRYAGRDPWPHRTLLVKPNRPTDIQNLSLSSQTLSPLVQRALPLGITKKGRLDSEKIATI